jgi:hypothetical protein
MTQQKITDTVNTFIAAATVVGFDKIKESAYDKYNNEIYAGKKRKPDNELKYPELQNILFSYSFDGLCIGGRPVLSKSVRYEYTKGLYDRFLESDPQLVANRLNGTVNTLTYYNCRNSKDEIMHRPITDPAADYAEMAGNGAMYWHGKNFKNETDFWHSFVMLAPTKQQLKKFSAYIPDFIEEGYSTSLKHQSAYYARELRKNHPVSDDYFVVCEKEKPEFIDLFLQETELLTSSLHPKENVANPNFVLSASGNHDSDIKKVKTTSFENALEVSREMMLQYPSSAKDILQDYTHRATGDMLLTLTAVLCARAKAMAQFGQNFNYHAIKYLGRADYIQTHLTSRESKGSPIVLYSHQLRDEIGEQNIGQDLKTIEGQTAYLKNLTL